MVGGGGGPFFGSFREGFHFLGPLGGSGQLCISAAEDSVAGGEPKPFNWRGMWSIV